MYVIPQTYEKKVVQGLKKSLTTPKGYDTIKEEMKKDTSTPKKKKKVKKSP